MSFLDKIDWWTLSVAVCCAVSCGTIGCFLVLRRLSLLGDAISHAILPGLAAAFILGGTREPGAMLIGALAVGLLTAGLTSGVKRIGRLPQDAALGVVFTSLFALGVLMITWVAGSIDLDPGCVLYGLIETVSLDMVTMLTRPAEQVVGGPTLPPEVVLEVPRALFWQAGLMLGNIALIAVLFKELRITSFDPALATALGISAGAVHFILLTAVAATTVISFEAVGSILVIALLVAPGATAQLLTDRLGRMVILSGLLGALAAVLGYLGAVALDASISGMISVAAGVQFLAAVIAAPRYGVVSRLIRNLRLTLRIAREDVLGLLYRLGEGAGEGQSGSRQQAQLLRTPGSRWQARIACAQLRARGHLSIADGTCTLTPRGVDEARRIIRAHRLWESFLSQNLPLPLDHLHDPSERLEHYISAEMQSRIAAEVGDQPDPHGKQIPSP